ncbi:CDP-diacylglycerol--serine O-phosphatidyltransferase [Planctomycetales bacterium 10988]|nr:CDP-diacylglycerol--serine O-phosphatidyltransferase [Planctomycetales bacterium 10988]
MTEFPATPSEEEANESEPSPLTANQVRRALLQELEAWQRAGISHLPQLSTEQEAAILAEVEAADERQEEEPSPEPAPLPAKATQPESVKVAKPAPPTSPSPPPAKASQSESDTLFELEEKPPTPPKLNREERVKALTALSVQVSTCVRCPKLAETRTQTVFGVGNPEPRLVFFGEAPGADEDRIGEPFVGRAGKLLTDMITKGCQMRREEVYILNVLKCRPPGNRNPSPTETKNCRSYFEEQLRILQPEFICCLGTVAAQALLNTNVSIGRLRKKFYNYQNAKVLCTYHPSYLLRNPSAKKDAWEDLKLLLEAMGIDWRNSLKR